MSKFSLVYFLLWILFQILVEVNCQSPPFKPSVSYFHTATLLDNKLYILGGRDSSDNLVEKEFFFLDVSIPFNTQSLLWQDLSSINTLPPHNAAASVKDNTKNDTLFLYGGVTSDQTMALVYTFNSSWSIPNIAGVNPIRKNSLTGIDHDGKIYLWGGASYDGTFKNDMLILDTINLSWGTGSSVNAPTPRDLYGATLLPNNNIVYLGGINDVTATFSQDLIIDKGNALTLNEVYIYNTINDSWSTQITSGNIPSNRAGFSTVLGLDGNRMIIYGGIFNNPPGYIDATLYVLDLTNFNWYVPKITGNIPKTRAYHKANVIGKYMVISFGKGYDKSVESDVLLLDISNNEEYIWTTTFELSVPNNTISKPNSSSSQLSNNNSTLTRIIAIVGSLFGSILLSFGSFLL
ncbi:hypothetical protein C1645_806424 [Glomus cerebriforme]|uniref:Galactose oxidase n=1 Tax=Glomus cerebriforme TaxID=658196 RepID=A0A397SWV1_9GLOM|nr:hypothetical protein C1645_806424 [Glomus cerebriforme]